MTDPRFYGWLWEIENEVRANVPMVYYHVWDNFPAPHFNADFYNSTDVVACISKVTHEIVQVAPDVQSCYFPHAVNETFFIQQQQMRKSVWHKFARKSNTRQNKEKGFLLEQSKRSKQAKWNSNLVVQGMAR